MTDGLDPSRLQFDGDLSLSVDGIDARVLAIGSSVEVRTDHPVRFARAVAGGVPRDVRDRRTLANLVDTASRLGVSVSFSGRRGRLLTAGAGAQSQLSRTLLGSPHVSLSGARRALTTVSAVLGGVAALIALRRRSAGRSPARAMTRSRPPLSRQCRSPFAAAGAVLSKPGLSVADESIGGVNITRQIVVFDAPDLTAESSFWAGLLGGRVEAEDDWHSLYLDGSARMGFQLAPNLVPADWPNGTPQQMHMDIYVDDIRAGHDQAMSLGARFLQPAEDLDAPSGFQVYADPAGHPFCLCWG